jgi:DNA repair exonuclease SbcCD ATPase subunit
MVEIKPTDRIVVDLEMYQIDYNESKKKALCKEIAEKYGIPTRNITINFKPITINEFGKKVSLVEDTINSIQTPEFQQQLMLDYINIEKSKNPEKYTNINFDELIRIDNQVNADISFENYDRYKNYKFKYLKWSNFLSYGENNYIDFSDLKGLVLMQGSPSNETGKTTFAIDLFRYVLFGKSHKIKVMSDVFNNYLPEVTEVFVEAGLEIDGVNYVIKRTVTRPALEKRKPNQEVKCKEKLEFYCQSENGLVDILNCEDENKTKTKKNIENFIGTINDYDLVVSATGSTLSNLIEMGQTDKCKIFTNWLGLSTLEIKKDKAKEIEKSVRSKFHRENPVDVKIEIDNKKQELDELDKELNKQQSLIIDFQKTIGDNNDKIIKLIAQKRSIIAGVDNIDISTLDANINSYQTELRLKEGQYQNKFNELKDIENITFNPDDLINAEEEKKKLQKEYEKVYEEGVKTKSSLEQATKEYNHTQELIKQGICPHCSQKIDIEAFNNRQNDIKNNGKELRETLTKLGNDLNEVKKKQTDLDNFILKLNQDKDTVNKATGLRNTLELLSSNIDTLKLKISNLESQKESIKNNEANIKYNNEIDTAINTCQTTINGYNNEINKCNISIGECNSSIQVINKSLTELEKLLIVLKEEESLQTHWNLYMEIYGDKGIKKLVLHNTLPFINNEIARMLNGLCDFEVELSLDEKTNILINIKRDDVLIDAKGISGLEKTLTSLAIRAALGNMSTLSKPNFLTLDEIIGTVAIENYDNLRELLNRMLMNYDFILHIAHTDMVRDWHDKFITIIKENNISRIEVE